MSESAFESLVSALPATSQARWREHGERRFVDALLVARAAWPEVELDERAFAQRLAEVASAEDHDDLVAMRPSEQYLVAACLAGSAAAVARFEALCFADVRRIARRFAAVLAPEELEQLVRQKLLVDRDGSGPGLARFSGAAGLRAWVRVIATRIALDVRQAEQRRERRHAGLPDALPDVDPELRMMQMLYTAEFRAALDACIAALSVRDRNLLRAQFVRNLRLEDIAAMYGVHRSTAARWLRDARLGLMQAVRGELTARLALSASEVDSVMRMVRSQVGLSAVTRGLVESQGLLGE